MERQGVIYIRVAQRDLRLASVRYRGLLPGCALEDLGWKVSVGTGAALPPEGTNLVVAVKPLSERDATWVRKVGSAGTPVVVDLCDNVFINGYGGQGTVVGQRFIETCSVAAAVTVPTEGLRQIVIARTGMAADRVLVVPDIVETMTLLARQRKLLQLKERWPDLIRRLLRGARNGAAKRAPALLWYGNYGASYANFGMSDLLLFSDALRQASQRHGAELWVVSNNRERFDQLEPQLPIKAHYFEWTPTIVDELLALARICLVPNSLDPFSATKSANRAVKALSSNVPVVATPTAAYSGLDKAVWLGDPASGVLAYLNDPGVRKSHLDEAKRALETHYSIATLRKSLQGVVAAATLPQERA